MVARRSRDTTSTNTAKLSMRRARSAADMAR